jgi:hypothetical protein
MQSMRGVHCIPAGRLVASLVVALGLISGAAVAAAPDVPNIDGCLGRLDPELDIGYDRIAARCPELVKQLEQGDWAPWLPRGWKDPGNDLSAGSLREFRDLVIREDATGVTGRGPDVRGLKSILNGLEPRKAVGWWSRFKTWLRSILEAREQTADESWFSQMVSHVGLPQSLRQLIAYASLVAVVLLAAVIVFNELRTAGLLPQSLASRRRRPPVQPLAREKAWSDIEPAPLLEKPRLLLELIVRRLAELGLLPPAGALTVRELARVARLPQADDRTRLSELAGTAERVRYSARALEPTALEESIAHGRELLERLDTRSPQ